MIELSERVVRSFSCKDRWYWKTIYAYDLPSRS